MKKKKPGKNVGAFAKLIWNLENLIEMNSFSCMQNQSITALILQYAIIYKLVRLWSSAEVAQEEIYTIYTQ